MMQRQLLPIARRLWRNVDTLTPLARITGVGDVLGTLYALPLAILGVIWLLLMTDWAVLREHWFIMGLIAGLLYLFARLSFFLITEIRTGVFADFDGSFEPIVTFSAVLLFGPSVMWISLFWLTVNTLYSWNQTRSVAQRWKITRNAAIETCQQTLVIMVSFKMYEQAGGRYPLPTLTTPDVLRSFYVMGIWLLLSSLLYLPLVSYWNNSLRRQTGNSVNMMFLFNQLVTWQAAIMPFGILTAGLYAYYGLSGYLFLMIGLILAALLAHQLSKAVENSRRRSIEMEKLENLGRAILNAPPDVNALAELLRQSIPNMFSPNKIEVRLFPEQVLLRYPEQQDHQPLEAWNWFRQNARQHYFHRQMPWADEPCDNSVVMVPIFDADNQLIGGICVTNESLSNVRDPGSEADIIPAVQALAAQISSALQRAKIYQRNLENQRMTQELALAGKIQTSFLPQELPQIEGWQIAAAVEPARQTSADFYDLIPLPDGRLGIVIADVADKGIGAALFMALSRTLIRTYATEYVTWPEIALQAANHRMIQDTNAELFVTVFYGVLDPKTGLMTYCNAGHNPAYLVRKRNGPGEGLPIQPLYRTGVPLGLFEDYTWEAATVEIELGDMLVLYTDGITKANNLQGDFFGDSRLQETLEDQRGRSARSILGHVTRAVYRFLHGAALHDDLTIIVLVRNV